MAKDYRTRAQVFTSSGSSHRLGSPYYRPEVGSSFLPSPTTGAVLETTLVSLHNGGDSVASSGSSERNMKLSNEGRKEL